MELNFRIVETPSHQVLLQKDFDNEDEENYYVLEIVFFINGIKASQKMSFNSEEKRNNAFDKMSNELIFKIVEQTQKMF